MRVLRRVVAVAALVAVAVGGGYLYAQPDDGAADEPSAGVPTDKDAQLSPKEMLDKSEKLIEGMKVRFWDEK